MTGLVNGKETRTMANFTQRIIGAAKLDTAIYEEVESDTTALGQALAVVVLSSVAAGIGLASQMNLTFVDGIIFALAALFSWLLWAWLTYFIGTRLLPGPETHADWGQLLRTTGFSASPGMLRILCVVPGLTLVVVIAQVWMLVTFVIAVRQALDYTSTWRAIGVCFIGWLAYIAIQVTLAKLIGF